MGCLDEGHFNGELENELSIGLGEVGFDEERVAAIGDAVKLLLQGLGEDVNREGLRKTPLRVAKALLEGTRGYRQKVNEIVGDALFPEAGLDNNRIGHAGGAGGLVVVRDLDHFSYCESCLLPFQIKCHVGYVPSGKRVLGLSKLSRVTDVFAKRLQEPQRLADEVCLGLQQGIKPAGVAVILQCKHLHFPDIESIFLESNHQRWVNVIVSSGSGVFGNKNADVWTDFFGLLKFRDIDIENVRPRGSSDQCWCPSVSSLSAKVSSKIVPLNPAMVTAVSSILKSLGEDPMRKELAATPSQYVKWLLNFQSIDMDVKLNVRASFTSISWSCSHRILPFRRLHLHRKIPFAINCTFLWFQAPASGTAYKADS
ncbi:hypothetical protein AAHE18_U022900 [Arachis hypogaea]